MTFRTEYNGVIIECDTAREALDLALLLERPQENLGRETEDKQKVIARWLEAHK